MINMSLEALLAFMQKNQYEANIQAETEQVYTVLKMNQREYPLFLRIFDQGHLLQLLVFLPSQLEPNESWLKKEQGTFLPSNETTQRVIADVARFLHLLNKELDLPGFGLDEMAGVVFYRLMLPTPKKKIDGDLLSAFLKTVEHVCRMFAAPIEAVSSGQMTLNQVLTKAREMEAN